MYAKVIAGVLMQYPYTFADLRADWPDTSFPTAPNVAQLGEFGIVTVTATAKPAFNPATQVVDEVDPVDVGGVWTQQWAIRAATQDEMNAYAAQQAAAAQAAADSADRQAAKADSVISYLVTRTPAEISAKVDADVTNLASAKTYIAKLAVAVSVLARKELR